MWSGASPLQAETAQNRRQLQGWCDEGACTFQQLHVLGHAESILKYAKIYLFEPFAVSDCRVPSYSLKRKRICRGLTQASFTQATSMRLAAS